MQTIWARQSRRQTLLAAALGTTAILLGIAAVVVAIRMNNGTANIPAPIVNITNPPPTINVAPGSPPAGPSADEPRGNRGQLWLRATARRRWCRNIRSSRPRRSAIRPSCRAGSTRTSTTDKPYEQYCYILPSRTTRLVLAFDGTVNPALDLDAAANGITPEQARTYLKSCRWHQ